MTRPQVEEFEVAARVVAIVRKRLRLTASLYEILQILSLTMFERTPLDQLLARVVSQNAPSAHEKQLKLIE